MSSTNSMPLHYVYDCNICTLFTYAILYCIIVKEPSSKVIVQNAETRQWQSVSSWHFMTSQQVYLACQTFNGLVTMFRKETGPTIDTANVRFA